MAYLVLLPFPLFSRILVLLCNQKHVRFWHILVGYKWPSVQEQTSSQRTRTVSVTLGRAEDSHSLKALWHAHFLSAITAFLSPGSVESAPLVSVVGQVSMTPMTAGKLWGRGEEGGVVGSRRSHCLTAAHDQAERLGSPCRTPRDTAAHPWPVPLDS